MERKKILKKWQKEAKKKKNSIIFVQDKGQTFSHSVQFLGAVELWLLALFPAPLNREWPEDQPLSYTKVSAPLALPLAL